MHPTTRLRLEWLLDSYLPAKYPAPGEVRLLDIGWYEGEPDLRSHYFTESGFKIIRLKTADDQELPGQIPGDACIWPELADASVDLVLSTHALEHSLTPWVTLSAIARVLKPGGRVCLVEPGLGSRPVKFDFNPSGSAYRVNERVAAFLPHPHLQDHYRFSPDSLAGMAIAAGLAVEHASMDMGPESPPGDWFAYSEVILIARKKAAPLPGKTNRIPDSGKELLPIAFPDYVKQRDDDAAATKPTVRHALRSRPKKGRVHLLGYCYMRGLASYLSKALPDYAIEYEHCGRIPLSEKDAYRALVKSGEYENADILIIMNRPELAHLRCRNGMTIHFPNVSFRGFHPDFLSPALQWFRAHGSCIAAESWLRGYGEEKTLALFNHHTYSALGYYSAWDAGIQALEQEFSALAMNLYDFLPQWVHRGVFMCDTDHPRDFALQDIIDHLLGKNGVPVLQNVRDSYFDSNFQNRLPVYPEIAKYLSIPEEGGYTFRVTIPPVSPFEWEGSIALDEFIHLSFATYRDNPDLLNPRAFIRIEKL